MQFCTRGNNSADKEAKSVALMKVSVPRIEEGEVQEYPPRPSLKEIKGYEKIGSQLERVMCLKIGTHLNNSPSTEVQGPGNGCGHCVQTAQKEHEESEVLISSVPKNLSKGGAVEEACLRCEQVIEGHLINEEEWKCIPAWGDNKKNFSPSLSQVPLQHRYEVLDLEGQLDDLEENFLPSEPPSYDTPGRCITTSNIKKTSRRKEG
ncbi:hypothetical protein DUI87_20536 [Hirundo rustica rustica]|uniref:Uncharacterized protein n=1 Tax=Hirundo rustica rustica TaxID=333673 RepID=A0A3M0JWZ5_HIRRU|nr:hypothetical protein DUI87_20536 [Hirundo rustica rustica]